jgi:hypothetical protein
MCAGLAMAGVFAIVRPPTDQPTSADGVVVFAGRSSRIRDALDLVPQFAPVVVVSTVTDEDRRSAGCGGTTERTVICVRSQDDSTKGEAKMFAQIAHRRGWDHVIAVTSQDHTRRAELELRRCFSGDVTMVSRGTNRAIPVAVVHEVAALAVTLTVRRGCG